MYLWLYMYWYWYLLKISTQPCKSMHGQGRETDSTGYFIWPKENTSFNLAIMCVVSLLVYREHFLCHI